MILTCEQMDGCTNRTKGNEMWKRIYIMYPDEISTQIRALCECTMGIIEQERGRENGKYEALAECFICSRDQAQLQSFPYLSGL